METCKKKAFSTQKEALTRLREIIKEATKAKSKEYPIRAYLCDKCNLFHLTKVSAHKNKFKIDKDYRTKVRENAFLKRETEFWEKKFKITTK